MSLYSRLDGAVRAYTSTKNAIAGDALADLTNHTLEEGLDVLQTLHDTLVDGMTNTMPEHVITKAHHATGVTPRVGSLDHVVSGLEALMRAVNDFHIYFLSQPEVMLCTPPLIMPDDTDEKLCIIKYDTRRATETADQALTNHNLKQETFASYISRINLQLQLMHNVCTMIAAITSLAFNHNITGQYLSLQLMPRMVDQSTSKEAQIRHMLENYLLNECVLDGGLCRKRRMTGYERDVPAMIMVPIKSVLGFNTGCYKELETLEDFVARKLTGPTTNRAVAGLLAGNIHKYPRILVDVLSITKDPRLPDYNPDPYLYAFQNGTYHLKTLVFRPYGDMSEVVINNTDYSNVTDEQHAYFTQLANEANERLDAVSDDELLEQMRMRKTTPCMFIDSEFCAEDIDEPIDDLLVKCTPLYHILEYQKFPLEVIKWVVALLGRALFKLPDVSDSWKTALYVMGRAGTGKSTILEMLKKCLPEGEVASMPATFEEKFGWESLYDKRLVMASEFPRGVPTEQLQSALSGESFAVGQKGKVQKNVTWVTPLVFAANRFWEGKANADNQLTRRLAMLVFTMFVNKQDPKLLENMERMLPSIIALITRMYNLYAREYGSLSFDEATTRTTDYFVVKAVERFVESNPVARYLTNPAQFTRTPPGNPRQYYMEWTQFQRLAAEYATKMNLRDQLRVEIDSSKYDTIMHALGLATVKERRFDYKLNKEIDGIWLVGCVHNELYPEMIAHFDSH